MGKQETAEFLDHAGMQMPVQWCFKSHLKDGRVMDLILRRVKEGNETPIEIEHEGGSYLHLRGRFSNATTLLERLQDKCLSVCQHDWMGEALENIFEQFAEMARKKPALLELFTPKGKMEIYHKDEAGFCPQYISGNFTLKLHMGALREEMPWVQYLIAQHLDYPFGPGERRFSTSRLFDLCFAAEKVIAPNGMAARIDAALQERGIYQPEKHEIDEHAHVTTLLDGKSAAIRTSYERVLQRERFASMILAMYFRPMKGADAPLLNHYRKLIELDLLVQQKNHYKDYPTKAMDQIASAIHVPLITIFKAGKYDSINARMGKRSG